MRHFLTRLEKCALRLGSSRSVPSLHRTTWHHTQPSYFSSLHITLTTFHRAVQGYPYQSASWVQEKGSRVCFPRRKMPLRCLKTVKTLTPIRAHTKGQEQRTLVKGHSDRDGSSRAGDAAQHSPGLPHTRTGKECQSSPDLILLITRNCLA